MRIKKVSIKNNKFYKLRSKCKKINKKKICIFDVTDNDVYLDNNNNDGKRGPRGYNGTTGPTGP
jgi:hypothetical protein